MRKTVSVGLFLLLFAGLLLGLGGCNLDEYEEEDLSANGISCLSTQESSPGETWAFYWYLCGSDLESESGYASDDLLELAQIDLPENVVVIIETGGSSYWYNDISPEHNSRYLYDSEGFTLLEELPIANMGDSSTLKDFLLYCNENFPADHQAVLFWNHGGGSIAGAAFDEHFDYDSLTLPEMYQAFEQAGTASGEKYELIGFDTCLMATIDVAHTFSSFAHYLVASEEYEPALGWDYEGFFEGLCQDTSINGAQLGKIICDTYYEACLAEDLDDMVTLSVVDLSKMDPLIAAYNNIGIEALINAGEKQSFISSFGRAARSAENYGGNNNSEGYTNMVDLGDLVRQSGDALLPATGEALLKALDDALVYQVQGALRQNASGLSCYYSYDGDYNEYLEFTKLNTSPAFAYYFDYALSGSIPDEIIDYIANASLPELSSGQLQWEALSLPDTDTLEDYPVIVTDDGIAVLNLGPDIADDLVSVYCNIIYVDEDFEVGLLLGSDNDLQADWSSGVFEDNFRGVWGGLDGELVYMELSTEADDYQVYAIPVLLNGEPYTLNVSYIYTSESFHILGLRRGIDENGMADKDLRPLIPGDSIQPIYYAIDFESDSDDVIEVEGDPIIVTEYTSFGEIDMGDGEFMFMFEMIDIHNNSFLSEVVWISVEDGEIYLYQ